MAKAYTGSDATLLLNDSELAKVRSFTLSASSGLLETTVLGDSVRNFIPSLRTFTGSAEIIYYKQDDGTNDASILFQNIINSRIAGATEADVQKLTLKLNDGNTNGILQMNIFLTGANIAANAGELITAQISFQATGSLPLAFI